MGVRKNAKLLSPPEIENFVRACVLMKAHIVNPAALPANQYSKWDEYVAIHWMIQAAFAPGASSVNFGHGGMNAGAYSFLSWHRYFLFQFEKQLQTYVAGVMLPYWDWTDPASIMTARFMGPNGTTNREVRSGYFARNAPGTAGNVTPAPGWWPATLTGWLLPAAFGSVFTGALRRTIASTSGLPSVNDLREALTKVDYRTFAWALESGAGVTSGNQMHNGMHGWIGGGTLASPGHMSDPAVSPFDPFFYLHHCNIDRLWAMWQLDGHAGEYPAAGALPHHGPNHLMYPWVGGAAGYGTNVTIGTGLANIPMPNFAAAGAQRNIDTLDFRTVLGYTYDSIPVIGIGLDRTGSMAGLTPDPMTTSAPDVSKWEAAKRGVSLFLQDCETVQNSRVMYVNAGVKTVRRLAANDFTQVFAGTGTGLVRTGGTISRAAFDSAVASMTPAGGTPLADALLDVNTTLVHAPFGGEPGDERRYLAMLTDGLLTAGAPFSSIPNGSLSRTAVFAMGFGTGAEVDYATLQTMVDKGVGLLTQQVFHGENAGTIDKFFTNALARAIGFTAVFDPLLQLFGGEHTHVEFNATTADDAFFITAQGMDFTDDNWRFHLMAPDGSMIYADAMDDGHGTHGAHGCGHCCRTPHATTTRGNARLTVMLQRDSADAGCWVGTWKLLAAYKTRRTDIMMMPSLGAVLFPLSAGPSRGPRYARLLKPPKGRVAQRNIVQAPRHGLDHLPVSTNRTDDACDLVINIYAQTRLQLELTPEARFVGAGAAVGIQVMPRVLQGVVTNLKGFARLGGPAVDLSRTLRKAVPVWARKEAALVRDGKLLFDPALALAGLERKNAKLAGIRDEELPVVTHDGGLLHVHTKGDLRGAYHLNLYVEGTYYAGGAMSSDHDHGHGGGQPTSPADGEPQVFSRILSTMVVVDSAKRSRAAATSATRRKATRR
jgi:tyrosinase-like protein